MSAMVYEQTLLESMIREHPLPLDLVRQAAREILEIIKAGLLQDGSVRVNNFGTFRLKRHTERQGRNPRTGETMTIPARNTILFYPCKALRELIEPHRRQAMPIEQTVPVATSDTPAPTVEIETSPAVAAVSATPETVAAAVAVAVELPPQTVAEVPRPNHTRRYGYGVAAALVLAIVAFSLAHKESAPPATTVAQTTAPATHAARPTIAPTPAPTTSVAPTPPQVVATTPTPPVQVATAPVTAAPTGNPSTAAPSGDDGSNVYFAGREHRLVDGDSLWRLAESSYHDALLWPHIYQANARTIDNPDLLHSGRMITLPTLQGGPGHLTRADRRNIAEGYYLTYLYYKQTGHHDAFFALLEAKRYSAEVVKEKRQRLHLSKLEETLLDLQRQMAD